MPSAPPVWLEPPKCEEGDCLRVVRVAVPNSSTSRRRTARSREDIGTSVPSSRETARRRSRTRACRSDLAGRRSICHSTARIAPRCSRSRSGRCSRSRISIQTDSRRSACRCTPRRGCRRPRGGSPSRSAWRPGRSAQSHRRCPCPFRGRDSCEAREYRSCRRAPGGCSFPRRHRFPPWPGTRWW